jgi:prepilin peptidase CpaA
MNLIESNLTFVSVAIILFTSVAVVTDLKSRQIPNWLTVSSFALALIFHLFTGGWSGLLLSIGGFATGFGILLVLWLIGGGGGGDVKLMGAIGAWVGPVPTVMIFVGSTVCAVVCMFALVIWQAAKAGQATTENEGANPAKNSLTKQSLPFAVPASMATWIVVLIQIIKQ